MIIYDFMGHMVSTESAEELHKFAGDLGMLRAWFQTPGLSKKTGKACKLGPEYSAHYDLTTSNMRSKARRMGAKEVDPLSLVKKAWWSAKKIIDHPDKAVPCYICGETGGYHQKICSRGNKSRPPSHTQRKPSSHQGRR